MSSGERIRQSALPADRVVNTTGAGDAFRGGFYAAAWRGLGPADQLLWGAAAASFAVEAQGGLAGAPGLSRLRARIKNRADGSRTTRAVQ